MSSWDPARCMSSLGGFSISLSPPRVRRFLLIEPKATVHTGDAPGPLTAQRRLA